MQFGIVSIDPWKATSRRVLNVLRVRVTVSRDAPMNSPISSCVIEKRKRIPPHSVACPLSLHSSNNRASFSGAVADSPTVRNWSHALVTLRLSSSITV